jgi:hypothetical protein
MSNTGLLLVFAVGIYCLIRGIVALKGEARRQAGILFVFMALCAIAISLLGLIAHALKVTRSSEVMVSRITLIIGGMWLAIFLIMTMFGHFTHRKGSLLPPDRDPPDNKGIRSIRPDGKTHSSDKPIV